MKLFPLFPVQASTTASHVDLLFAALTAVTILFSLIIFVAIVFFAVRFRRGHKVDRSNAPLEHLPIEIMWTGIPLVIALGLFIWSTALYFIDKRVPDGAMEIYVVGKQWMWKLQHPEGRWEMNELHVPVGRPVKLTMTSEDVIHSFFVPAFRLKQDVIPGKFTTMWFTATKPGHYHLFCAEYCGTNHSGMIGQVVVLSAADYEKWLRSGNTTTSMAAAGEKLFMQHGCNGCHGAGSSVRAPFLEGIYGKPVPIQVPTGKPGETKTQVIIADDRYIHDAIVLPEQEIAAGFKPIMPTFKDRLKEEEIVQIIDYIKSLSTTSGSASSNQGYNSSNMDESAIRARTGFKPQNMGDIASRKSQNVAGTMSSSQ